MQDAGIANIDDAKQILESNGISVEDGEDVKKQVRKWALTGHPDKGGDGEVFKKVWKAWQQWEANEK